MAPPVIDYDALAPVFVRSEPKNSAAPAVDPGLAHAIAKLLSAPASSVAPAPASAGLHGGVSLKDFSSPKASAKMVQDNGVMQNMDNLSNLSEFSYLLKKSGVAQELENASADGHAVTVFAPTNRALANMTGANLSAIKMLPSDDARQSAFVRQHAVLNMDKTLSSAKYELNGARAGAESMQGGSHISFQREMDNKNAGAHLAVRHDDDGDAAGAGRIMSTTTTMNGHTIHIIDTPLA